jgi:hypothetical protein
LLVRGHLSLLDGLLEGGEDVIFPASPDRNTAYPRWLISFLLGLSSPYVERKIEV